MQGVALRPAPKPTRGRRRIAMGARCGTNLRQCGSAQTSIGCRHARPPLGGAFFFEYPRSVRACRSPRDDVSARFLLRAALRVSGLVAVGHVSSSELLRCKSRDRTARRGRFPKTDKLIRGKHRSVRLPRETAMVPCLRRILGSDALSGALERHGDARSPRGPFSRSTPASGRP